MARRGVGDREGWAPLYPAGVFKLDVGVAVGAHKTAGIANMIQRKLAAELQKMMVKEKRF
jgi:hypothetical protein